MNSVTRTEPKRTNVDVLRRTAGLVFAFCCILLPFTAAAGPAGKVEVILVKPNKIVYEDGEAGTALVRLYNPGDAELAVTLRPTLKWDLEESKALPSVSLKVPPKKSADATVPLPGSNERWGRELRVEAVVDGKVEDVGRQFYQVTNEWMDVILISFKRRFCPFADAAEPFVSFTTVQHWFAWAPGDYTDNAPKVDEWYAGQVAWKQSKKKIQAAIRKCHEQGIHCTFYNNAFTNGKSGLEWARRHPEWICRNRDASPMLGGDPMMLTKPHSDKATGGNGNAHMAFYDTRCIEWGAQNVIESVEMFGWDGMFWDCGGCALFPGFSYDGQPTPHGKDPNELSARNFRLFHKIVRKKYPHFGVWINGSVKASYQPFWSRFGNSGGPIMLKEQMSSPQTALLCEHRHHDKPGGKFHHWDHTHDVYIDERDGVIQKFGAPIIAGYTTFKGYPAQSHLAAIILACQMRPANCHQEGSWPMTQFMTRYSAILWDDGVRLVKDPSGLLEADLSRPVWWRRHVYRRKTDGGEDVMVHFINQPVTKVCDPEVKDDPPPATGTVTLTVPKGKKLTKVLFLRPRVHGRGKGFGLDTGGMPVAAGYVDDPENPGKKKKMHVHGSLCREGPLQIEVPAVMKGGTAEVKLPEVIYHGMLVFRLEG